MPAALGFGSTYASTSFFSLYTSIWTREKRHKRPLVNDSSESSFIDDGNKVGTTWQRDCLNWVSILRRSHKEKNKSLSSNSRAVSWWKKVVYCSLWSSSCRPPSGRRWIVESHQCPSVGHFFFYEGQNIKFGSLPKLSSARRTRRQSDLLAILL